MSKTVEDFARAQREHYDSILADAERQLDRFDVPDKSRSYLLARLRDILDADHERCVVEFSRHLAAGGRTPTEPVH